MRNKTIVFVCLHILLLIYSCGGILSKTAAGYSFLSIPFILCYGGLIFILGVYAIGWQQIIKRLPLTVAFASKAVTVVWGMLWGILFFQETIGIGEILGALFVIGGVVLYTTEKEVPDEK